MADTEIIQEDAAKIQLLEEVKDNRLPVQVTLVNGKYNGITHINGIRHKRNTTHFRTENMPSFAAAIKDSKNWQSQFEFYGKDSIQYIFRTAGLKIGRDGIWYRLPEIIERMQRRKFFRLELPLQMNLFLTLGSGKYRMTAIDISIGGIFVELMSAEEPVDTDPPWRVGEQLEDLLLETDSVPESNRIQVQEGCLRRVETDSSNKKYKYAFEFTKMAKSEETALVNLVYELQRKILKERIKINA